MNLLKHTLFINLDERPDRLGHVQIELKKLGIKNEQRISGIRREGNGALGCTLSHIQCLEKARDEDYDHVFICEDDITFTDPKTLLTSLLEFERMNLPWDVLIVGGNAVPPYTGVTSCCAQIYNCQTTTGYIVKKHYYSTLINNFRESAQQNRPLDIGWKILQQQDGWFLLLPLTVTQYPNYSNIENRVVNYDHLMLDAEKKWLFCRW